MRDSRLKVFEKMFTYLVLVTCACYVVVKADSTEDLKVKYVQYVMECSKLNPLTQEDIEMLRNKRMPDSRTVRCVFDCMYRKAGILDAQGNLSVQQVYAISEKYLADDPVRLGKAKQFAEACRGVNKVSLPEEDEDCERAALIFKCSVEKAPQFDFIV